MVTLELALSFISWLEPKLAEAGAHCGLTGSVLYEGESKNDFDIIVYPHNGPDPKSVEEIEVLLKGLFPKAFRLNKEIHKDLYPASRPVVRVREVGMAKVQVDFLLMS